MLEGGAEESVIDHDDGQLNAGEQIVQIVVHLERLKVALGQFLIQGRQFFVGRLQFLLRGLQLFVGRLQLFVARLDFFIGRFQFFVGCLLLFDDRL